MTAKKSTTPAPKIENIAIKIGADLQTVEAASKTVLNILESSAENETKRVALQVFQNLCGVNGVTISDCHVEMGK